MLTQGMPYSEEPEGSSVPSDLLPVIDAHVHIFPDSIFSAVRKWFDDYGWHIRYQLSSEQIIDFLLSRGIEHVVALQYAHKPGIAAMLNEYMVKICNQFNGKASGLATVYPGEAEADSLLQKAFDDGLIGVKLHMHVQCFALDSPAMEPIFDCSMKNGKPMVIHASREPKSDAYNCDPYLLCSADKVKRVLQNFPGMKLCVPHMGVDEFEAYRNLIETYDTLWLDTAMAITDYFPACRQIDLAAYRPDRIMYGSDFPNIPYAWDRELKVLAAAGLDEQNLEKVACRNAMEFFSIPRVQVSS